jgi:hypothetical protein
LPIRQGVFVQYIKTKEKRRMKRLIWLLCLFTMLVWNVTPALAGAPEALAWLRARQNADGGFAADSGGASDPSATVEAIFAGVAGGQDPAAWTQSGNTPISFLESKADSTLAKPGDNAKLILAVVAAKRNPRSFGGVDLVASLESKLDPSGVYGGAKTGTVFEQTLAILALKAVRRPIPVLAVDWLTGLQLGDGSWSWNGDTTPGSGDSNTTALAVQALVAAGGQGEAGSKARVVKALGYLHGIQNKDGGFPYQKPSAQGSDTDANSTAYVMQAIIAAGGDPAGADWTVGGNTPLSALAALQLKSGAFTWQNATPADNFLATTQAVPALAGKAILDVTGSLDVGEATPPASLPATGGVWPGWGLMLAAGLALGGTGLALRRHP